MQNAIMPIVILSTHGFHGFRANSFETLRGGAEWKIK